MRVLCFIDSLGSGGAQRQMVNLAIGFKESGHDVEFLVYSKNTFYEHVLKGNEIHINSIYNVSYFKRVILIRKFIRSNDFDVVLSFLETPNFIATLSGFPFRRWKLIVGERSADPRIKTSLRKKIFRFFHLFTDKVVANSQANLDLVLAVNPFLRSSRCCVIYNAVSIPMIKDEHIDRIREKPLKVLVAATHRYVKNAVSLVKAISLLPANVSKQFKIDWYGDVIDESYEEVVNLVKEYNLEDVIIFNEATNDIYSKMMSSDIVGLFSLYEGLPNTICEAMSLGKCVVCSKVSDVPLFLKHSEDLLFDPTNLQEISNVFVTLSEMTGNEIAELGKKNAVIANEKFSKQYVTQSYLNLFK